MRAVLILVLLASACAKDVHVRYPAAPDEPTGTIVLLLSQPASDVYVAINGMLVVEDAHTQRIVITHAPAGSPEIVVTANGGERQLKPWVGSDGATTIPLGVPDASAGFLKTLFGSLVSIAAYTLLR
jgi:hypothetical protein